MVDLIESLIGEECKYCIAYDAEDISCRKSCDGIGFHLDAIADGVQKWLSSFDASSATQCFTAVNQLKQKLEEGNA